MYLWETNSEYANDKLRHTLDDATADIDYSLVQRQFRCYQKGGGKKTLQERKADYRKAIIRDVISEFLGEPGTTLPKNVLDLNALDANVDIFVKYLTDARKGNGGLLKGGSYASHHSSLTYLFWRYQHVPSRMFEVELKECMEGIKRVANEAHQLGEGSLYDGDRPLSWALYEQFNRWFYAEGTLEGIFALAFSKVTYNLACRGKSTSQVCTKHIKWLDDCFEIPFAYGKDRQTGVNNIKKLSRHCYANPMNLSSDLPSALFQYFALNPNVIANAEESLFPGGVKAQVNKFGRMVTKICFKYRDIIKTKFGFDISEIGVHSWCKCARTKLNYGSTAGPTGAAACIRGGHHAMGGSKDVYIPKRRPATPTAAKFYKAFLSTYLNLPFPTLTSCPSILSRVCKME